MQFYTQLPLSRCFPIKGLFFKKTFLKSNKVVCAYFFSCDKHFPYFLGLVIDRRDVWTDGHGRTMNCVFGSLYRLMGRVSVSTIWVFCCVSVIELSAAYMNDFMHALADYIYSTSSSRICNNATVSQFFTTSKNT